MLVADCCGDAGCAQGQQVELAPPHTPPEHVVYAQARRVAGKRSRRASSWKDKYKPQVKGRRHLKNNFEDGLEEEETNGFGGDE